MEPARPARKTQDRAVTCGAELEVDDELDVNPPVLAVITLNVLSGALLWQLISQVRRIVLQLLLNDKAAPVQRIIIEVDSHAAFDVLVPDHYGFNIFYDRRDVG